MAPPILGWTSWCRVSLPCFAGAVVAALGAVGWLDGAWVRVVTHVVVAIGYALPFLAWRSPRESSLVKLLVLSACASPPLGALAFCVLRSWLATDAALAVTFALPAAAALPLSRLRGSFGGPSRVVAAALVVGLGLAGWSFVRSEPLGAALVGFERLALTRALEKAVPPGNPLLAGTPWPYAWPFEGLLAYVASASQVAPHVACAALLSCALLVLPALLALTAAPLVGDAQAELAAVVGGLLGVGAFASGAHWPGLLPGIAGDPARALALVWLAAAGLASAHALRHGRSPWIELVGLFHAFAFALDPRTAALSIAAVALAAVVRPARPEVRPRVLLAGTLSVVPALLAARVLGLGEPRFETGFVETGTSPGNGFPAAVAWVLVALAVAALARPGSWNRAASERLHDAAENSALRTWLALAVLLGLGGSQRVDGVGPAFAGAVAGFVLGAALVRASRRSLAARVAAAGIGALVVASGIRARARVPAPDPVERLHTAGRAYVLEPTDESSATERDVLAALRWLALELPFEDRAPILITHPARPLALDDRDRFGERAGALASVLANLDLWCTTRTTHGFVDPNGRRPRRLAGAKAIYETRDGFDPELIRELEHLGRPGIVLVTRRDRWRFPWLENKFGPHGFAVLKVFDSVGAFVWPPELAERVPAAERAFPEHHFPSGPAVYGREEER